MFFSNFIISVAALIISISVMIITCNQNDDEYLLTRDALTLSEKQFDTTMKDRISDNIRDNLRDSAHLVEFKETFRLEREKFGYEISQDKANFDYQQQINKKWLSLLDSQSINTAEALKFQKQLVDRICL